MGELIGPYNLTGTLEQNAILKPMAVGMADILALPNDPRGWRVLVTNVRIRERDKMPWAVVPGGDAAGGDDKYPDGVRARGFWNHKSARGDILLSDDLFAAPDGSPELARKTFAHEGTHQLDDQWMLKSNERSIRDNFEPDASGWPSEAFAVYGSAAIFGFDDPPYRSFYKGYRIPKAKWPETKEEALRDNHPVEPVPPEPIPEPPDSGVVVLQPGQQILVKVA